MSEKCQPLSCCRAASHRKPRKPPSNRQSVWRSAAMHLKPYPKQLLQKSELRLEPSQDNQRGLHVSVNFSLSQQGALRTEWGVRPTRVGSSNNGLGSGRYPLSVISTNTLCCDSTTTTTNNNTNSKSNGPTSRLSGDFHSTWARKATKASPGSGSGPPGQATFTSSLVLLATTGSENEAQLSLYQAEDGEGPLDIWAVIKPGNTKEKIAIFASQQRSRTNSSIDGERESTPDAEENPNAVRTVSMKAKGCWEKSDGSVAKRRRRSGPHQDSKPRPSEPQSPSPPEDNPALMPLSPAPRVPPCGVSVEQSCKIEGGEERGKVLSVVEMVAFLEQRATDTTIDSKPVSLRSSTSITLSKGLSLPLTLSLGNPPAPGLDSLDGRSDEDGESVRVLDMVAKLESECLKRQSSREGGDLSRNNSLRRSVGRVLLAGADACSAAAQPPPTLTEPENRLEEIPRVPAIPASPSEGPASLTDKPCSSPCEWAASSPSSEPALLSHSLESGCGAPIQAREPEEKAIGPGQLEDSIVEVAQDLQLQPQCEQASPGSSRLCEEPLPGMLFFSHPSSQPAVSEQHTHPHTHTAQAQSQSHVPQDTTRDSFLSKTLCEPSAAAPDSSLLFETHLHVEEREEEEEEEREEGSVALSREPVPFPLRRLVSHEFLEMRFKIQLLLEPQQYLAFLPHHIMVKIFCMLPTQTLAALKCTCHYFKFIIESYGVRPADSRWVCDPRYKDDPCKQCKKRYCRGDVSLCRWHHKPYCQALPYGPGYWMCCHGSHKDTAGCNVGLHDNRWVPAFHSINMPIYKKPREVEEEA